MIDALNHSRKLIEKPVTRRGFIKLGAFVAAAGLVPRPVFADIPAFAGPERRLAFYNTHTGENLDIEYWEKGEYIPGALAEINHVLRDHRTDEVTTIHPDLLDLLHSLGGVLDVREPFHVISGYRSPKTNAQLRKRRRRVARHSLHMEGMAVDVRVPGLKLSHLSRAALSLKAGGVGTYPRSNFIHLDIGPVRRW
ncbi:MAG: YcbK family protein [Nitrospirota bacterium]